MALSREQMNNYLKRLLFSRMRLLMNHGFYGLLLMHTTLSIDEKVETAYTDGDRIVFGTSFLDDLSDSEVDFIMMHEILHIVLSHCFRYGKNNSKSQDELFNIACDIVVNSNILKSNDMNLSTITLDKYGESMHLAPNSQEGYNYTAEEVYEMLLQLQSLSKDDTSYDSLDDHSKWSEENDQTNQEKKEDWLQRVVAAKEAMDHQKDCGGKGGVPECVERIYKELTKTQTDWKSILSDFVQENVCDYSFSPPDKRMQDSPFFLPDFNGTEVEVSDILFMIDTSGSMTNEMINIAYSEIKGAIDQFDDKLQGWLGFFDHQVYEPVPFADANELLNIKGKGGGGTNFDIIFDYVNNYMQDNPPKSIIILTDGECLYPDESIAKDIPVLWLINNDKITPPWGRVARVSI